MNIAALVAWILTAAGGFVMLAKWISHGGVRSPGTSRFPPGLIFSHFGLAAAGLVLWIIYLINDEDILAWVAFALLVVVALLGFTMLVRWLPGYRARATVAAGDGGAGRPAPRDGRATRRAALPRGRGRRPRRAGRRHRRAGAARRARGGRQLRSGPPAALRTNRGPRGRTVPRGPAPRWPSRSSATPRARWKRAFSDSTTAAFSLAAGTVWRGSPRRRGPPLPGR